jgi:hypothetical protein
MSASVWAAPIIVWTHFRIQPHGPDCRKAWLEKEWGRSSFRFIQKENRVEF